MITVFGDEWSEEQVDRMLSVLLISAFNDAHPEARILEPAMTRVIASGRLQPRQGESRTKLLSRLLALAKLEVIC